jgi:hypothetical protein
MEDYYVYVVGAQYYQYRSVCEEMMPRFYTYFQV